MSLSTTEMQIPSAMSTAPASSAAQESHRDETELVIRPRKGWIAIDWAELWGHRELLYFLVWRDVKVRYKQAVLGFAWAILAPVISVTIFTLIFGRHIGTSKTPGYPPFSLFIFAAMIPWLFVAQAISAGGMSLVSQQNLLSKIYMPRLFIPAATIGSALVDACISFFVFLCWMAMLKYVPSWHIVFLPGLILLTVLMALGLAFLLSALTVTYRDLRFLIPFITQIGMWVSAVVWPVHEIVPANKQWILMFNPLFGLFDAYRSAIFGLPLRPMHLLSTIIATLGILTLGLFYFRKTERRFADIA